VNIDKIDKNIFDYPLKIIDIAKILLRIAMLLVILKLKNVKKQSKNGGCHAERVITAIYRNHKGGIGACHGVYGAYLFSILCSLCQKSAGENAEHL